MNELFKTKIGFIISLLAVVFTVKPIINDYSEFGFSILEYNITALLAYKIFTILLCLSVYCISIQFVFPQTRKILIAATDLFYALSLTLPLLFIALWGSLSIANNIDIHLEFSTETIESITAIISLIISFLSIIGTTLSYKRLNKTRLKTEKTDYINKNVTQLERAHELFNAQMYDLSVLEAFKVIESILRELASIFGITEHKNIISLINECQKLELLEYSDIELIHMIRKKRNASAHLVDSIDKDSALQILQLSSLLIQKLEMTQNSTAYIWLMRNRKWSIDSLKDSKSNRNKKVIQMLTKAWDNRDGAISGEISCFFETALIHSPKLIIESFAMDSQRLDNWLDEIQLTLFTDFTGNLHDNMLRTKDDIIKSLEGYIEHTSNSEHLKIATTILNKVKDIEIIKID